MWKERSFRLWGEIVPHPTSQLEQIKEKVEILNWKKITKFLHTTEDQSYGHDCDGYDYLHFVRYKAGEWIPTKSVHIDFRIPSVTYGEFLNRGNGHGVSHRPEGTYNGQWKKSLRLGQGNKHAL
eukprot:TRINITY_DN2716_c0_g3_i2.p1 TRINITY_DN2716_c0_g3~~TRINITY_DN2716_c0_g3_i2.p1  ORF type:complete len:124 (+),score=17.98 TRINITY_DN2716_c0_g3_i2:331-702(+)